MAAAYVRLIYCAMSEMRVCKCVFASCAPFAAHASYNIRIAYSRACHRLGLTACARAQRTSIYNQVSGRAHTHFHDSAASFLPLIRFQLTCNPCGVLRTKIIRGLCDGYLYSAWYYNIPTPFPCPIHSSACERASAPENCALVLCTHHTFKRCL